MKLNISKTLRGFSTISFLDRQDESCSIQRSGNAGEPRIWLGLDNERMLLNQSDVKKLVGVLNLFIETGDIQEEDGLVSDYVKVLFYGGSGLESKRYLDSKVKVGEIVEIRGFNYRIQKVKDTFRNGRFVWQAATINILFESEVDRSPREFIEIS